MADFISRGDGGGATADVNDSIEQTKEDTGNSLSSGAISMTSRRSRGSPTDEDIPSSHVHELMLNSYTDGRSR